jgi:hypothetical protein
MSESWLMSTHLISVSGWTVTMLEKFTSPLLSTMEMVLLWRQKVINKRMMDADNMVLTCTSTFHVPCWGGNCLICPCQHMSDPSVVALIKPILPQVQWVDHLAKSKKSY